MKIRTGIPQGDSLSPTLFNEVRNELIEHVQRERTGNRIANITFKILCYANNAALKDESKEDLQRILL